MMGTSLLSMPWALSQVCLLLNCFKTEISQSNLFNILRYSDFLTAKSVKQLSKFSAAARTVMCNIILCDVYKLCNEQVGGLCVGITSRFLYSELQVLNTYMYI